MTPFFSWRQAATQAPVLAVMVLAGAAAWAQPAPMPMPMAKPPGAHPAMHHSPGQSGLGGHGMMSERLLDQVGATAEQKAKIREILKAARGDGRAQHDETRRLHQALAAVLAAPQVDAAAAEGLRQKLQAQREVQSKRMLQAMLDVSAVLTPEQRQKLAERQKQRGEMMERHHREREALDGPRS